MDLIRSSLGGLPVTVHKSGIHAYFIEAILFSPGIGNSILSTPHPHSITIAGV